MNIERLYFKDRKIMVKGYKEVVNKFIEHEIQVPCIKCSGRTAHEIMASVDQSGSEPKYSLDWWHYYQIIKCKGCKALSYREVSATSEDYFQIDEDEWELMEQEKLYPSRIEGRKDLGEDILYLPSDLARIYRETAAALTNNLPILAGIGLRAIVETVCKEKKASGKDLYNKINDLVVQRVITPVDADILHKVRSLGNSSAHEVKPHTPTQLSLAMGVLENMLKAVYILPKLIKDEFD